MVSFLFLFSIEIMRIEKPRLHTYMSLFLGNNVMILLFYTGRSGGFYLSYVCRFDCMEVAGSGTFGPINGLTTPVGLAVVTPTDLPKWAQTAL